MKRCVIQIGNSTQLISLPRQWCKKYNILKGDELEIDDAGPQLIVSTGRSTALESANIFIPSKDRFTRRPIDTLYRAGYDEIIVRFDDPSIGALLTSEIDRLIGFEIVDQSSKQWVLRNVATALEAEFDAVLRRIMLMLSTMAKDMVESFAEGNFLQLEEIARREQVNNRLTMFCQRLLNKRGYHEFHKVTTLYHSLSLLEMVADTLRDACLHVINKKKKPSKLMIESFQQVVLLIQLFSTLHYSFDINKLIEFRNIRVVLEKKTVALLADRKEDCVLAHYTLQATTHLHHATHTLIPIVKA